MAGTPILYPAVMLTATVFVLGPGLPATAVSALLAAYFILPPSGLAVGSPVEILVYVIFTEIASTPHQGSRFTLTVPPSPVGVASRHMPVRGGVRVPPIPLAPSRHVTAEC